MIHTLIISLFLYASPCTLISKDRAINQATIVSGYDYSSRLLAMKDATENGQYNVLYDTAGRQIGETRADIPGAITWTLDGNGNRTSLNWPEGGTLAYSTTSLYDALNRLTDVYEGSTTLGTRIGHYNYDTLSQRTQLLYGGTASTNTGMGSVYSYTAVGQLANVTHIWPNGLQVGFDSTYNQDHQRTSMVTPAGWLWSAPTGASASYTSNALNQYANVSGITYSYDPRGNLTGDGTWTYTYDTENRLVQAVRSGVSVSYAYDPRGRRKAKTVTNTSTGASSTTLYLSAGDQEISEYSLVPNVSLTLNVRYVYGPGLDEPLAIVGTNLSRYFFHADPLGSTVAATNPGSGTIYRNKYTAYGLGASSNVLAYQFAGRRYDAETGLYYNRARMYSPTLGRFLQPDPIKTDGGINIYAYVGNDPLNRTDPKGQCPWCIGAVVGAAYGGIAAYMEHDSSLQSVLVGAGVGAIVGGVTSGLGLAEYGAVGVGARAAVSAYFGDIAGQVTTNALNSRPLDQINFTTPIIAAAYGALGGVNAAFGEAAALSSGFSPAAASLLGNVIGGGVAFSTQQEISRMSLQHSSASSSNSYYSDSSSYDDYYYSSLSFDPYVPPSFGSEK